MIDREVRLGGKIVPAYLIVIIDNIELACTCRQ